MISRLFIVLAVLVALPFAAFAKEAAPAADDPVLEKRVMTLAADLRCLVCQNQTLAESPAGLADDLKNQMRQQMRRGASDQEVIEYLVARYGDFVLYRPPLKATTVGLWFGPAVLLLIGIFMVLRSLARRRRSAAQTALTEAGRARADALLAACGQGEQQP